MFDPTKLVSPLNAIIADINKGVNRLMLTDGEVIVKSIRSTDGHYNTSATVDIVDTDGVVIHENREVLYNRIDLRELVDSTAIPVKDINGIVNYNIITDYELEATTIQPTIGMLVDLFNDSMGLSVEEEDLQIKDMGGVVSRDTSLGKIYKEVNCSVSANTVMFTGGNVSVYQRTDTYPFSYNKETTSQPGCNLYREWLYTDELEITLPEAEANSLNGWTLMFEDIETMYELGDGKFWFRITHDDATNNWVYMASDGSTKHIDSSTITKIKISTVDDKITINCLSFVNNNSYESVHVDQSLNLTHNRGLNRITLHSNNPTSSLFTYKLKLTKGVADDRVLINNVKNYEYNFNKLTAIDGSNALINDVDKNIVLTNYIGNNYTESTVPNSFVGNDNAIYGSITSYDSFTPDFTLGVTYQVADLSNLIATGIISRIGLEIVNVLDDTENALVVLRNFKTVDNVTTMIADSSVNNGKLTWTETLSLSNITSLHVAISRYDVYFAINGIMITSALVNGNLYDDVTKLRFRTKMNITMHEHSQLPLVDVTKAYQSNEVIA